MVVRRESGKLRRYCHCGTGNYHPNTARIYTDYGLFTCDEAMGEDLHELFLQLTSPTRVATMQKILQSPFTLHEALLEKTQARNRVCAARQACAHHRQDERAVEPQIIQALYHAAMAGVKIDLIVRGICALRPGIRGISENITVRSIVGRFLEHSRVYYFHNDGNPEIYCASADWMERNFFRRIEVCFPIERKQHRDRIVEDLETYLADNAQAWVLRPRRHATSARAPTQRADRQCAGRRCCSATRTHVDLADAQPEADRLQILDFVFQIGRRERDERRATLRETQSPASAPSPASSIFGSAALTAPAMQQHRQTQQHDQKLRLDVPRRTQVLQACRVASCADARRRCTRGSVCSSCGKSGHVRVLEQIRAVLLIVRMRDVEADLVQARGPRQHQLGERLVQPPSPAASAAENRAPSLRPAPPAPRST